MPIIDKVPLKRLEAIVNMLKKEYSDDDFIPFTFIIASLFPNIWNNIQEEMKTQFTRGYSEGIQRRRDE